ncbi:MAG: hypothetical protein H6508_03605 [Calditrichaeota bacterium]|nr:hypothetical protein [Calditrichota bacterium]MCB9366260.1 hypothetical protein [Calditrichota bacterium]
MNELLQLEFKGHRTEYAVNPQQYPFVRGDLAIVTTDRGQDLGKVAFVGLRSGDSPGDKLGLVVLRRAREADVEKLKQNREREAQAKKLARAEIARHNLEMKLVDVELQWDGRKMTFYFTAEGRVDFRELVRDLANKFRTRIDLRQIGARDETKKTSGYGICGRPLCCATFLTEFKPITTQMPRDQFLPLNPSKLSGVCGRLKCCLRYELDIYREFQRECPKIGHPIKDEAKGMGEVDKLDVVRGQIQVRYSGGTTELYTRESFVEMTTWRPQMPKNECICTCGKKSEAPQVQPAESSKTEDMPPPSREAGRGDKITLHGEGGFRVEFEDDEDSLDVSTEVNVSMDSEAKRKRRRKKKRPQGSGEGQAAQQKAVSASSEPAQSKPAAQAVAPSSEPGTQERKKRRRGGRRKHGGQGGSSGEGTGSSGGGA